MNRQETIEAVAAIIAGCMYEDDTLAQVYEVNADGWTVETVGDGQDGIRNWTIISGIVLNDTDLVAAVNIAREWRGY